MKKLILAPSILGADFMNLGDQVAAVEAAGAQYVHFDVMDGIFVPSISMGMPVLKSLRKQTNMLIDVHLMIVDPPRYAEDFAQSGADIITFHYEACDDVAEAIDAFRATGKKVGLAIKPNTDVSVLYPYLHKIDMALIMTVEPGFGGQKLIPSTLDKVLTLKSFCERHAINIDIEVDGGINFENFKTAIDSGANVIVAGTAVFSGDVEKNVSKFMIMEEAIEESKNNG
ncbi:MAG: ribulose-phosphate 3-epimerase [Lachnospiraceae bacterium]|nr:ribulose-phosphate 3-epimerase [Lachnospiraceae bacterium]